MLLDSLISGLPIAPPPRARLDVRICDLTEDSRTVMPGSLFIARKGHKSDGRVFIASAIKAGAVAVLCDEPPREAAPGGAVMLRAHDVPLATALLAERFYGSPSSKLACIGVTGTNGKTTVTYLVHQMLNAAGMRCGLMGTVCIDDGSKVAPASLTTPPALEISRTLAHMIECGCTAAALETSSHALDQRRVAGLAFRVGVFTNLTHDHLDYHGTMERYAQAKAMLFGMLPAGGAAIVNADDPAADQMVRACKAPVVRCSLYGRQGEADLCATISSAGPAWTQVDIAGPFGVWRALRLPLLGAHNVMNALQAVGAVIALGVEPTRVREQLAAVHAPPGRLQPVTSPSDPFSVYIDYAHSDDALERVLQVARNAVTSAGRGRVSVVFGCGGDRDRAKRPKMGALAVRLADRVVITSDNPRTEDPQSIIEQILAGIEPQLRGAVAVEPDRRAAIGAAVAGASPGDIVLIAGKGHEDYQILPDGAGGTNRIHFDDADEARAALAARGMACMAPPTVSTRAGRSASGRST